MRKIKLRQMLAIFMMVANVLVVWGQTPTTASNPFSQTIEEANQQGKMVRNSLVQPKRW